MELKTTNNNHSDVPASLVTNNAKSLEVGAPPSFMELKTISENNFVTIDNKKMAKILERMPEIRRIRNTTGRQNTQTTNQLMTLTMMCDSPYRRLRQCLSQIEKKHGALNEAYYKMRKLQVEVKGWEVKDDEMSRVLIEEAITNMEIQKVYIEGALKEIGIFQDSYDEIRESHNIPEKWDEGDAERAEINAHLRQAFRQAHRDMVCGGTIGIGNMEYLEQFGVHLQTAQRLIVQYIKECEASIDDNKYPTVDSLYKWLDKMAESFKDSYLLVTKHIGIKNLIKNDWLYTED